MYEEGSKSKERRGESRKGRGLRGGRRVRGMKKGGRGGERKKDGRGGGRRVRKGEKTNQ